MKQFNLTFLLTVLMSMVGAKASAYDIAVKNADGVPIYYNFINDSTELEVTFYFGAGTYTGSIVIPETVTYEGNTYPVTAIGREAFYYCALTSVTIPNSVTSIGNSAFYGCAYLTSVTIPNSVTTIESHTFSECRSLASVTIGSSVTSIGSSAFTYCSSLVSVTIPNSVTSIGSSAFTYCSSLVSVTIPNSVTTIGTDTFYECTNLANVTIPNSVTSIGSFAFSGCSSLVSVTIPDRVTEIGEYTFNRCSSLIEVTIPNSTTEIGSFAFRNCSSLVSVTIGSSVNKIGSDAFSYCDALTTLYSLNTIPPHVSSGNFTYNQYMNLNVYVPQEALSVYRTANVWQDFKNLQRIKGTGTTKCATPTIRYANNTLTFSCDTDDVIFESEITDTDIALYSSSEIQLGVTYNINVCATKVGYEDSDVATATLCWIDVEPKTEGIDTDITLVRANAVLVQAANGQIDVTGLNDGTKVIVYNIDGTQIGSAISRGGQASINANMTPGSIAIVKIGDKSIKIVMK